MTGHVHRKPDDRNSIEKIGSEFGVQRRKVRTLELEGDYVSVLRVESRTVVHLHDGILCSRKKEGAPTLPDSMDGTGEHYAKRNKPGSEGQIPYDLTYKWNIINKTNNRAKYNQRLGNKEQTDSNQRGRG